MNQSAKQYNTYDDNVASRGVDGDTGPYMDNDHCVHTGRPNPGKYSWWTVNVEHKEHVTHIINVTVYNRHDSGLYLITHFAHYFYQIVMCIHWFCLFNGTGLLSGIKSLQLRNKTYSSAMYFMYWLFKLVCIKVCILINTLGNFQ